MTTFAGRRWRRVVAVSAVTAVLWTVVSVDAAPAELDAATGTSDAEEGSGGEGEPVDEGRPVEAGSAD